MLNINKIESDFNFRGLTKIDISEVLGIPYMTAVNRLKSGNWTPDDIEKIADFFQKPISYYFDREEKPVGAYVSEEKLNVVNEPCPGCEQLRAELARLADKLNDKQETIDALKEANTALKGEAKKEKPLNRTA